MAPADHAPEVILGMGRGAMILSLFGALWLGLSVDAAGAWTILLALLLGVVLVLLVLSSWLSIGRGKALRKLHLDPGVAEYAAQIRKRFRLIGILEAAGIVLAIIVPQAIHRPYLIADWIAIVVGIHFVPLASLFRAAVYYVTAIAIVAWSVLAWVLFRGNSIPIIAGIGTGIILWLTAAYVVHRARKLGAAIA